MRGALHVAEARAVSQCQAAERFSPRIQLDSSHPGCL